MPAPANDCPARGNVRSFLPVSAPGSDRVRTAAASGRYLKTSPARGLVTGGRLPIRLAS